METCLDVLCFPDIVVEQYMDEYKSFIFKGNSSKDLSADLLSSALYKIAKLCGATYWKCIHVYIRGYDKWTQEEYCINNDTLDIPFKKVNIHDLRNAVHIIFNTLLDEPEGNNKILSERLYGREYNLWDYYGAIEIQYLKIIMKRFKPEKKYKRKGIPGKVKLAVMERDDYKCQMCGATVEDGVKLHIDHIVPWSKGGDDTIDNLQVLCHKCNLAKTNRMDLKCTQEKLGESDDKSKA